MTDDNLPEPVAWMHDGFVSTNKERVLHDEMRNRSSGFKAKPVFSLYTESQLRAALAAQAEKHAVVVNKCNSYIVDNARLAEANDALRAEVEALRAALKPFADADLTLPTVRDTFGFDVLRARAALAQPAEPAALTDAQIDEVFKSQPESIITLLSVANQDVTVLRFKTALRTICRAIERAVRGQP